MPVFQYRILRNVIFFKKKKKWQFPVSVTYYDIVKWNSFLMCPEFAYAVFYSMAMAHFIGTLHAKQKFWILIYSRVKINDFWFNCRVR
jgi:hypothetical protein